MTLLLRCLFAAVLLGACPPASAGEGAGTSSAMFLTLPHDPAIAALGGVSSVGRASALSLLGNPAGLADAPARSAQFSHAFWLDGISYNTLAAAGPYYGGVAAFGLRYLRYGEIDALDNAGADAGTYSPRDAAVSVGWGARAGRWTAGGAVKYVSSRIDASADAFAVDSGLGYSAGDYSGGISLENLGGKLKFGREEYPLPLQFKAGASRRLPCGALLLLEGVLPRSGPGWLAAGGEYPLRLRGIGLALRGGYSGRYGRTGGLNGLTLGLGLTSGDLTFDYALTEAGELGAAHQFGLGLRWGGGSAGEESERPGMMLAIPG